MTLNKYFFACVCALIFLTPLSANADVTLMWDSNIETDLAGYQIGFGLAPGEYTEIVEVGNRTSYLFTDLQADHTYYFAVRAYNTAGFSSPFSEEVSATTPSATPLQVTNIFANLGSPAPLESWIILSAAATGGTAPYQYKWFISSGSSQSGSTQTVARDWAAAETFTWAPSRQGFYTITVWARSATSTADAPDNTGAVLSTSFEITRKKARTIAPSFFEVGSSGDK